MLLLEEEVSEQEKSETGEGVETDKVDYIGAIKDLKKNSVSKAEFMKLQAENKKLLESLVNGQEDATGKQEVIATDEEVNQLRKELYSDECNLNNLEYVTKTLALRKAIIQKGGLDPFVPISNKQAPSQENFDTANRVASILQECVDLANGSSQRFTTELQERMN